MTQLFSAFISAAHLAGSLWFETSLKQNLWHLLTAVVTLMQVTSLACTLPTSACLYLQDYTAADVGLFADSGVD